MCYRPDRWSSNSFGNGSPPTRPTPFLPHRLPPKCSGPLRIPPASKWLWIDATVTGADQLAPPLVELNAEMPLVSIGTTTFPLGCTRGCPPIPPARFAVPIADDHVSPPSVDV